MSDNKGSNFTDRRQRQDPIPTHLERFLSKVQLSTLLQLQAIGWHLWFVRRPLFQPAMPVLCDPTNQFTAVIEEDGHSNFEHGMSFRPD